MGDQRFSLVQKEFAKDGRVRELLDKIEGDLVGPFAAGTHPTIADIYIYTSFGWWGGGWMKPITNEDLVDGCPKLRGIVKSVSSIPAIKSYHAKMSIEYKMESF